MVNKNLDQLVTDIVAFNHARGWNQHPMDHVKSIVIEAAELLEHFQWDCSHTTTIPTMENKDILAIKKEVADIFWYLTAFCHEANIDLKDAIEIKFAHNSQKYPVEKFNGKDNREFWIKQHKSYRQKGK